MSGPATEPEKRVRAREFHLQDLVGRYGTLLGLVGMLVLFSALRPNTFPTVANFLTIVKQGSVLTLVALGITVVLILREFDLAVGYQASFVGIITVGLMAKQSIAMPVAILIGLLIGLAIGAINGVIVSYLNVNSLIATLGTGSILVGATFLYSRGAQISSGFPRTFLYIARGSLFNIPNLVWIMLAVALVLWILLSHTEAGRRMYAIGGNPNAAWLSGISLHKYKILGFALSGLGATIGGIALASLLSVGHPQAADGFLLDAYTAAFLGAVTLSDGEFHIWGTVTGVLILSVALNGLTMIGAEFYVQNILKGAVLLVTVAASGIRKKIRV